MKIYPRTFFTFFVYIVIFHYPSFSQPGSLDQSFGSYGKVTTDFSQGYDYGYATTINAAGEVFVAGKSNYDLALIKYKSNGNIDSSFGIDGKVIDNFFYSKSQANAVVIQPDGKIIVSGGWGDTYPGEFLGLIRYLPSGKIDSSFGVNGKVTSIYGPNGLGEALIVLNDGKILVSGLSSGTIVVARYFDNGIIDSTFGINGIFKTQVIADNSGPLSMGVQSTGKIVIATTIQASMGVMRLNPNGTLDDSFAMDGIKYIHFASSGASGIVVQPDDKIVVGGIDQFVVPLFAIARLQSDGNFDSSFGENGITTTSFPYQSYALSLIRQADGKLLLGGFTIGTFTGNDFTIIRYNSNGIIDSTFGVNGIASADFNVGQDYGYSLALASDQKIILAGYTLPAFGYNQDFAVARFNNDAVLPILLLSFTSEKLKNSVLLNWAISNPSNIAYYIIERSNTSYSDFVQIDTIKNTFSISNTKSFSFEDTKPVIGNNYYRLKIVDKNGLITYSKLLNCIYKIEVPFFVYPNPVNNFLNINNLPVNEVTSLSIVDNTGTVIKNIKVYSSSVNFNVSDLKKGFYYLHVQNKSSNYTFKFLRE